jgi:hypothetical protein
MTEEGLIAELLTWWRENGFAKFLWEEESDIFP